MTLSTLYLIILKIVPEGEPKIIFNNPESIFPPFSGEKRCSFIDSFSCGKNLEVYR
ncbi:MAG: hypothetical protein ACTSRP_19285 [Candidatus Helarchaeota archaeon]